VWKVLRKAMRKRAATIGTGFAVLTFSSNSTFDSPHTPPGQQFEK
jgi:hypothetical protein